MAVDDLEAANPRHSGMCCSRRKPAKAQTRNLVKLTFAQGAALKDPAGLFNAGFGGGTRRAIDIHQGGSVDAAAFRALVGEAVALNIARQKPGCS